LSFPESQRIVFAENPLIEVISQLTFPSILAIAAGPPAEFQEAVRGEYPIYERIEGLPNIPPELRQMLSALPVPVPVDAVTHRFSSETGFTISLAREFIAVATTNYTQWLDFRQEIERAKSALEETYRPAFYTRLGLRYRDIIDRERLGLTETPWRELLNRAILGVLGADESIQAGVRAARGEASIALDDPQGAFVNLTHGLVDESGNQYAVDADWFTEERSDADAVFEVLDRFNSQAGNLFRWAIEPRLRDAMGTRDD
jgi:uncharacterized protein (TIGR04255 family)